MSLSLSLSLFSLSLSRFSLSLSLSLSLSQNLSYSDSPPPFSFTLSSGLWFLSLTHTSLSHAVCGLLVQCFRVWPLNIHSGDQTRNGLLLRDGGGGGGRDWGGYLSMNSGSSVQSGAPTRNLKLEEADSKVTHHQNIHFS